MRPKYLNLRLSIPGDGRCHDHPPDRRASAREARMRAAEAARWAQTQADIALCAAHGQWPAAEVQNAIDLAFLDQAGAAKCYAAIAASYRETRELSEGCSDRVRAAVFGQREG